MNTINNIKTIKKILSTLFISSGLISSSLSISFAAMDTASVAGAAKVNSSCTILTNNLSFGTINASPTGKSTNSTTVSATCTKDTAFTISFDGGNAASLSTRHLTGQVSADILSYNIYKDNSYSQILGDGNNGTVTISDIGSGLSQNYIIYGALPLNQYTTPDIYSDNLVVSLDY